MRIKLTILSWIILTGSLLIQVYFAGRSDQLEKDMRAGFGAVEVCSQKQGVLKYVLASP